MKRFIVDQFLLLLFGVVFVFLIPRFCGRIFSIIFISLVVLSWAFLCRRLLLLPLDFLMGKKTQTVFYATQYNAYKFEFFRGIHCNEWKFYFGNNKTISLLHPQCIADGENSSLPIPQKNEKVTITYYKHAKILLNCEKAQL